MSDLHPGHFIRLVREQAGWNRANLAQGRVRAFVSAWLDVRGVVGGRDARDLETVIAARGISRQAALNALAGVIHRRERG